MKKFIFILALSALVGDPLDSGFFEAPTGERVWWKWFGASLGVMDSDSKCIWNEGEPRPCTFTEFSMMLNFAPGL